MSGALDDLLVTVMFIVTLALCGYLAYYYLFGRVIAPTRTIQARIARKFDRCSILTDSLVDSEYEEFYGGTYLQERAWEAVANFLSRVLRRPIGPVMQEISCFLEIDVEGKRMEFTVSMDDYASVSEGDEGWLRHKGNQFISFRTTASPRPDLS